MVHKYCLHPNYIIIPTMLSSAETPRPLPPAKARRATMLKLSSTPPPAYHSAFTFPSRRQSRQDIHGSPMTEWDSDPAQLSSSPPFREEELDWIKDKSREEIEELLVTADDLIKEREHGRHSLNDMIGLMTYPFSPPFISQNLILARQRVETCIRMRLLSSLNMKFCYPKFLTLLQGRYPLLVAHHICYPEL